jgi:large subunit ribosomal protein L21
MPKAKKTSKASDDVFAIIETGGKQYKVAPGEYLKIEKLKGDTKAGDSLVLDKVLLVDNKGKTEIGKPYLGAAKVEAEVLEVGRNPKVTVIKYKAKSRYFKKRGHRQPFIKIKIKSIK